MQTKNEELNQFDSGATSPKACGHGDLAATSPETDFSPLLGKESSAGNSDCCHYILIGKRIVCHCPIIIAAAPVFEKGRINSISCA